MAFTKVDKTVEELNVHSNLSRTPNASDNLDYKELQGLWDSTGQYIADKINALIDELQASGSAPSLGFFPNEHFVDVETVQQACEFLYDQIVGITLQQLVDGSVTSPKLYQGAGEEAVITSAIRDAAVTSAKIAALAITTAKIASGAITTEKIADGAVTAQKLGNGVVGTSSISNGAVNTDKIANNAVTDNKIASMAASKLTGLTAIENGGTGANTADNARANLGVAQFLKFTNISVAASAWASDITYEDYPYRAKVTATGVTSDFFADVVMSVADLSNYSFAPVCETTADGVYIYCDSAPEEAITVVSIAAYK